MWLLKTGVDTAEVRPSVVLPSSTEKLLLPSSFSVVLPIHALPPRPTSQQSYVSARGYALLSLPQQMNWLTSSGFVGQVIAL